MTPNIALTMSPDGLSLLHRQSRGWLLVGEAPLDHPRLSRRLARLREHAERLAPQGMATKLVLPAPLLLFTTIHAPGPSEEERRAQIEAGLEGLTPYAVSDLVFDWVTLGDDVRVAAVARETLDEAEAFAVDHGFRPLCFVALPEEDGAFEAEPWFGLTRHAMTVQGVSAPTLREDDPAYVVGRATIPEKLEDAAENTANAPSADRESAVPAGNVSPLVDDAPPAGNPSPEPAKHATSESEEHAAEPAPPEPSVATPEPATAQPKESPERPAPPAPTPAVRPAATAPALTPSPGQTGPAAARPVREPEPSRAAALRNPAHKPEGAPPSAGRLLASVAAGAPQAENVQAPPVEIENPESAKAPPLAAAPASPRAVPARPDATPRPRTDIRPRSEAGGKAAATPAQQAAVSAASMEPADSGMSVFGARKVAAPGRTRTLGYALTGALVLLLIGVALWSTFLTPQQETVAAEEETPVLAADLPQPAEAIAAQQAEPGSEPLAAPSDAAETAEGPTPPEGTPETATAQGDPAAEPPSAAPLPGRAFVGADTPPAVSEAPPSSAELTANMAETARRLADAEAPAQAPDAAPADEAAPDAETGDLAASETLAEAAPATGAQTGTEAGVEAPTEAPAEGSASAAAVEEAVTEALEADVSVPAETGVAVTAGPPPVIPPARPRELPSFPTDGAAAPADAPATTADTAAGAPAGDPALAGFRPRLRPASAAPAETPAEAPGDQSDAGAIADQPTVLSLVPRARPAALVQAAAPEPEAEEPAVEASALALVASPQPEARPSTFTRDVERALAAAMVAAPAQQAAAAQPAPAQAAPPQPTPAAPAPAVAAAPAPIEEDDEPDIAASAVPNIPTTASVAAQATYTRAINLRQDNLIGVYGTASNRRALVRSSNGRMLQLRVGDRYDGGQVAAITERDVQYIKNGRTFALSMPQS